MNTVPDHIRRTSSQGGGTVLDLKNGTVLRLNFTGSFVFECLSTGKSQSQIVEELSAHSIVSRDTIEKDVVDFINSLEQRQIVVRDFQD